MSPAAPLLDLRMRPNRSLEPRHFRWMLIAICSVFLLGGARLLALGAWPVIPFLIADVALFAWAFRASYRSGDAFEEVRLDAAQLVVRKVTHWGREHLYRLEPFWTRVELEPTGDRQNRLWLVARERRVAVGGFLSPPEREQIAGVIGAALDRHRSARG